MAERKTTRKKQDKSEQVDKDEAVTVDETLTKLTATPDVEIVYREDGQPMEKSPESS
jgi:hypothetical protein